MCSDTKCVGMNLCPSCHRMSLSPASTASYPLVRDFPSQDMFKQSGERVITTKSQLERVGGDLQSLRQRVLVGGNQLQDHASQREEIGLLARCLPAFLVRKSLLLCLRVVNEMSRTSSRGEGRRAGNVPKKTLTYLSGAIPVVGSPMVDRYSAVSPYERMYCCGVYVKARSLCLSVSTRLYLQRSLRQPCIVPSLEVLFPTAERGHSLRSTGDLDTRVRHALIVLQHAIKNRLVERPIIPVVQAEICP